MSTLKAIKEMDDLSFLKVCSPPREFRFDKKQETTSFITEIFLQVWCYVAARHNETTPIQYVDGSKYGGYFRSA